jgi:hypothetical protein
MTDAIVGGIRGWHGSGVLKMPSFLLTDEMTTHELKSWPEYFDPLFTGVKTFELRFNDRRFKVGDVLRLREYDDRKGDYTGREISKRIIYMVDGIGPGCITPMKGLSRGYAILALADV